MVFVLAPLAVLSCSVRDNHIHTACVTDDDCNPGRYCAAQRCELLPKTTVEGADAGFEHSEQVQSDDAAAETTDADFEHGEQQPILELGPADGSSTDFGDVSVGDTRNETLRITNMAAVPSRILQISLAQGPEAAFAILDPTADECVFGITSLAGGDHCSFRIRFSPTGSGAQSATLRLESAFGLGASAISLFLSGKGNVPATLTGVASFDFGTVFVGSQSDPVPWEIKNMGDLESDAPVVINSAPTELIVDATECDRALGAHDSCAVLVAFAPASKGARSGTLTFSAGAAGAVKFSASATGKLPAFLTLEPADDGGVDFGDPFLGQTVDRTFVLHNLGEQSSSAIDIVLNSEATSDFALLTGDPEDCVQSVMLVGDASCRIRVRFSPSVEGSQSTVLSVSAEVGRDFALDLRGTAHGGAVPPSLSGSTGAAFGASDPGVASIQAVTWTITNPGDLVTGILTLDNSDPSEILVQSNGCVTALGPGEACTVEVAFRPSVCGLRAGTLTLNASPGGEASLSVTGAGRCRLTILKSGTGTGTIAGHSLIGGFGVACDAGCSETSVMVNPGTLLTLSATTTNGSDSFFTGWTTGTCQGRATCDVVVASDTNLTTPFSRLDGNLIFVTSDQWSTNRFGVVGYDQICNSEATNAGINNATGSGYIAFVSDALSSAISRLGSAEGWIRRDGKPFAGTQTSLFSAHAVFNSVRFDAWGVDQTRAVYLTGTGSDGNVSPMETCLDWTSTTPGDLFAGTSESGPLGWAGQFLSLLNPSACARSYRLLCMGNTHVAVVSPSMTPGRKIWMTNAPFLVGGPLTPDDKCRAERPDGVAQPVALLAYTNRPASAVLALDANYVRPDGTLVGSGAQIAAGQRLESGPWQTADGRYLASYLWLGQTDPQSAGTLASTCGDWTDVTQTAGGSGRPFDTSSPWSASTYRPIFCQATGVNLLCVETAP